MLIEYYDSENPRIEIIITVSDNIGIFDSQGDYDEFTNTCKNCKRYKNNCSLLKKAKESRIQKEIELINNKWACIKFNAIVGVK